jgi:hypothetical protein
MQGAVQVPVLPGFATGAAATAKVLTTSVAAL